MVAVRYERSALAMSMFGAGRCFTWLRIEKSIMLQIANCVLAGFYSLYSLLYCFFLGNTCRFSNDSVCL